MTELSVIICTHNPRAHYLARVLAALRSQTLPTSDWELILVDNASEKRLKESWDLSWHPKGRHTFEERLGLSHAREKGMRTASTDLMVFVDDDNVLDSNYLLEALALAREWGRLGVWGCGTSIPEYEVDPPRELRDYLNVLAIFDRKKPMWSNVVSCGEATPCGVGLCVRREVAESYLNGWKDSSIQILDRNGKSLASGGDYEIAYTACKIGLGMGIFPQLRATHLIPKERLNEEYLINLREGVAQSICLLNYKWNGTLPRDYRSFSGMLSVLRNVLCLNRVARRMYLAEVQAAIRARQTIAESKA